MTPNILLVSFDALRRDFVFPYAAEESGPPLFRRAAESGIHFLHAYSNANWTVPSHASLFTGLEPHEHRIFNWRQQLQPDISTLFSSAKKRGYQTAFLASDGVRPIVSARPNDYDLIGKPRDRTLLDAVGADHRPWCVFWHFLDTHAPYGIVPPREPDHSQIDFDLETPRMNYIRELICTGHVLEIQNRVRRNLLELSSMVEEMWDRLGESTVVVLLSDHGEEWRPYHPFHCSFEEPILRIPLIVSAPGLSETSSCQLISHADLSSLIWGLAQQPAALRQDFVQTWQSKSQRLGRILLCGPDSFDNAETFFAARNSESMVVLKPSTKQRKYFAIHQEQQHPLSSNHQRGPFIDLDQALDEVMEHLFVPEPESLTVEETEMLLAHLRALGYMDI